MAWMAKNKKTGEVYGPLSNGQKDAYEKEYITKGKFTYKEVADPVKAPAPVEAKIPGKKPEVQPEDKG